MTDPVKLVQDISAQIEGIKAENLKINEAMKIAIESHGADAKAAVKAAEDSAAKVAAFSENLLDIEQKLTAKVHDGKASVNTLGQTVIASEKYKLFASGTIGKARIEANTITGQSGSPAANNDIIVPSQRVGGIIPLGMRALNVFDVLPQGSTTSNIIEVTREATNTNAAEETDEGDLKPQSSITYNLLSVPIATIATFLKVTKQVLDDAPQLQAHIDMRLMHNVQVRYQNQIVAGAGTSGRIGGILKSGNYTAFTPTVTADSQLDNINRMIQAVRAAEFEPTGIMLNTADWHAIERLKVGTSDDRYIIGNPAGAMVPMLWGKPVVISNSVTSGTGIVGDFSRSYMIWNRQAPVVELFEQDESNVQYNLITVRAELRGALAAYVPTATYAGSLTV